MHPKVHAARDPEKVAIVMAATGREVTYGELEARSNQLAHVWGARGLVCGDTIAIVLENHEWFLPLAWSAQRSGLYYACLSPTLSASDLAYILRDCGAKLVVGSLRTQSLLLDACVGDGDLPCLFVDARAGGAPSLTEAAAAMPPTPVGCESAGQDMLYSSGTTGRPKGVRRPMRSGEPIDAATPSVGLGQSRFGLDGSTVYLSPAPLYHAGPLRWAMTVQRLGGTVIVMDRFEPEEAMRLIEHRRITHAQWVPTHFIRMLQLPDDVRAKYDVTSLRCAFHAAAPCPVPVKEAMMAWWGPIIHEYYGGTENNGLTMISPQEWLDHPGSVGRAVIGQVKICDAEDEEAPPRVEGGVYFAGGPPFEYHNDPAKTESARNRRGWTTLGDIGWLDEEGYLYLTDRKSFMIISGGVNIYPQEIENVLVVHPKVADVAVVGAPDPVMGERVVAVVQPRHWADAGPELAEELKAYARGRLGGVKTPRQFDFMETLPREPTGKLYKRLLRDRYWEAADSGPTQERAPSAVMTTAPR